MYDSNNERKLVNISLGTHLEDKKHFYFQQL